MEFQVRKLNSQDIQNLKDDWLPTAEANEELPTTSFKQAVTWAENVENGSTQTQASVYGVICSDGRIHAIFDRMDIHLNSAKGYFKILSMVVAPHLDLSGIPKEDFFVARQQFSKVIAEVIAHGMVVLQEHPTATKVKFFASGSVTLGLFQKVWATFDPDVLEQLNLKTDVYGNWAEFSKI
ncbi:hypothetical protein [Halomonas sp. DWK9]|uniref:hypothetical protein n=1 Tax=Halomonas sp. DWK9 TaxID=3060155 RepID=UPI00287F847E|nr:hypothetical protein [Halomonas sp. DWK9]